MARPRTKQHYVDNEKFLVVMGEYREECLKNIDAGEEIKPRLPEYLGDCFMKIAQRLSFRPNFINYAFKDEMISDGIENCVQYIKNFNPEKSSNPFAYFTQIIYYAFIRRIQKEKKQLYIKYKQMDEYNSIEENSDMESMSTNEQTGIASGATLMTADKRANIYEFINQFEEKKREKKNPKVGAKKKDDAILELSPLTSFMRVSV